MAHDIQPKQHYSITTMQIALHCIDGDEAADGLNELIGLEIGQVFIADYAFYNSDEPTIIQVTDEPEEGELFVITSSPELDAALMEKINASGETELLEILLERPNLANNTLALGLIKIRKEALNQLNWNNDKIQFPRLISEISANISLNGQEWSELRESISLGDDEINELFNRADRVWENIKANMAPDTIDGGETNA